MEDNLLGKGDEPSPQGKGRGEGFEGLEGFEWVSRGDLERYASEHPGLGLRGTGQRGKDKRPRRKGFDAGLRKGTPAYDAALSARQVGTMTAREEGDAKGTWIGRRVRELEEGMERQQGRWSERIREAEEAAGRGDIPQSRRWWLTYRAMRANEKANARGMSDHDIGALLASLEWKDMEKVAANCKEGNPSYRPVNAYQSAEQKLKAADRALMAAVRMNQDGTWDALAFLGYGIHFEPVRLRRWAEKAKWVEVGYPQEGEDLSWLDGMVGVRGTEKEWRLRAMYQRMKEDATDMEYVGGGGDAGGDGLDSVS